MGVTRSVECVGQPVKRNRLMLNRNRRTQSQQQCQIHRPCEFWTILRLINRQAELQRLVSWAERKHLSGPRRCYETHLEDTNQVLLRYWLNYPGIAHWAQRAHYLNRVLSPVLRYPKLGSAAAYVKRNRIEATWQTASRLTSRLQSAAQRENWEFGALISERNYG